MKQYCVPALAGPLNVQVVGGMPFSDFFNIVFKRSWSRIIREVLEMDAHEEIKVGKSNIVHPKKGGFGDRYRINDAEANYGCELEDGRGIHIEEHEDFYAIHWDYYDSRNYPVDHFRCDASGIWVLSTTLIGSAIGAYRSEDALEGATKGGLAGFFFGLLTRGGE